MPAVQPGGPDRSSKRRLCPMRPARWILADRTCVVRFAVEKYRECMAREIPMRLRHPMWLRQAPAILGILSLAAVAACSGSSEVTPTTGLTDVEAAAPGGTISGDEPRQGDPTPSQIPPPDTPTSGNAAVYDAFKECVAVVAGQQIADAVQVIDGAVTLGPNSDASGIGPAQLDEIDGCARLAGLLDDGGADGSASSYDRLTPTTQPAELPEEQPLRGCPGETNRDELAPPWC